MSIGEELQQNLANVLSGTPWYGRPIYDIIEEVSFEAAYEKIPGAGHTIAEIVLHMISWTEEVMDRMNGMNAQNPTSGDWPETGAPDEQKWQNYYNDLKLVSVNLLGIIQTYPEENWNDLINDEPESEQVTTYKKLITGFIQHQVYHAGQIAVLNKIING